jgi:hypothetical protein
MIKNFALAALLLAGFIPPALATVTTVPIAVGTGAWVSLGTGCAYVQPVGAALRFAIADEVPTSLTAGFMVLPGAVAQPTFFNAGTSSLWVIAPSVAASVNVTQGLVAVSGLEEGTTGSLILLDSATTSGGNVLLSMTAAQLAANPPGMIDIKFLTSLAVSSVPVGTTVFITFD